MLSDEQMSKRLQFSLLNDEQMSNGLGVEHLPDRSGLFFKAPGPSIRDRHNLNYLVIRSSSYFCVLGGIEILKDQKSQDGTCSLKIPENGIQSFIGKLCFFILLFELSTHPKPW